MLFRQNDHKLQSLVCKLMDENNDLNTIINQRDELERENIRLKQMLEECKFQKD